MEYLWNWVLPMIGGFVVSFVLLKIFIPVLRKAKLGQKILEIGPAWHKCKEGTPVLGGLFFLTGAAAAFLVWCLVTRTVPGHPALSVALLALLSALIGFIDDYVKLFKKRNKGLSAKQKMVLQFLSVALFLVYRAFLCPKEGVSPTSVRMFGLFGLDRLELSWFYYPIMLVLLVYLINCANLTDGIDGLEGSISWIHCLFFLLVVHLLSQGNAELGVLSAGLLGGLTAYLIFNFHPAKIFMGDTGSLFLGGFVTSVTVALGTAPVPDRLRLDRGRRFRPAAGGMVQTDEEAALPHGAHPSSFRKGRLVGIPHRLHVRRRDGRLLRTGLLGVHQRLTQAIK